MKNFLAAIVFGFCLLSCDGDKEPDFLDGENPDETEIYTIPLVVHVLHNGQEIGEGPNLSKERIEGQIRILNEDFRRKVGTRGYNEHPDGGDSKIEFVLARQDPFGNPTDGIVRVDTSQFNLNKEFSYSQNFFSRFSYWDAESYINIWVVPLPPQASCIVLGQSTGPETDLPGAEHLEIPQHNDIDGILINWAHFGESDVDCHAKYGRTLTHEMGHYLGLLHTWGVKDCDLNDYCDDTPAVDVFVFGSREFIGCQDEPIMIGNYMNYSDDIVMNIFTNDQIERMHHVLESSPRRKSLLNSRGLSYPQ